MGMQADVTKIDLKKWDRVSRTSRLAPKRNDFFEVK